MDQQLPQPIIMKPFSHPPFFVKLIVCFQMEKLYFSAETTKISYSDQEYQPKTIFRKYLLPRHVMRACDCRGSYEILKYKKAMTVSHRVMSHPSQ